ncbi:MAG TPA: LLM class F420-dependent oxidoreductase [Anaerolineales bacterium]|nr:LLM class F420-dependent oxidoreductase [Anaerolineales bacterium]
MQIGIMIEGQNGLNWQRWQRLAKTVEELGFMGLFRSDHFTNASPPDLDSLELWTSLTWLASHTHRIEFGPMVSPISFRHPAITARMAVALDDLSEGRLTLGLGAGWQEREHHNFGFELLDMDQRFSRFEEGLTVIQKLLRNDQPSDFDGQYFKLRQAIVLPRPQRSNRPRILIGGNGEKRTLPLVARFADEWNALFLTPTEFSRLNRTLDGLIKEEGRNPEHLRRSMMTGCIYGNDIQEVKRKVDFRTKGQRTEEEMRQRGLLVGTAQEIHGQILTLEQAGVQRLMLQWLDLDDLDGLASLAKGIIG